MTLANANWVERYSQHVFTNVANWEDMLFASMVTTTALGFREGAGRFAAVEIRLSYRLAIRIPSDGWCAWLSGR